MLRATRSGLYGAGAIDRLLLLLLAGKEVTPELAWLVRCAPTQTAEVVRVLGRGRPRLHLSGGLIVTLDCHGAFVLLFRVGGIFLQAGGASWLLTFSPFVRTFNWLILRGKQVRVMSC